MRCKPGDLAIVIDWKGIHTGKVVTVVCFSESFGLGCWEVSPETIDPDDGVNVCWNDASLRPIRDQDGEDETLTWAGRPKEMVRT